MSGGDGGEVLGWCVLQPLAHGPGNNGHVDVLLGAQTQVNLQKREMGMHAWDFMGLVYKDGQILQSDCMRERERERERVAVTQQNEPE